MRTTIAALLLCGMTIPAFAQDVSGAKEASQKFTSAMSGGDAATASSMFSEDAFVLPPGRAELKGKSEIQMFLNGMAHGVQNLQYVSEDIRPLGDGAAREMGTFSFKTRGRQGGSPQDVKGKYLIIWEKAGSEWKIAADMWNRNGNGQGGKGRAGMKRGSGGNGGAMQPQNEAQ
ncbi:MAG TPA: nuclear transport factor 2 family protein [Lichenihabitans sp.]|jgi:ketosteroid isomerase-like protein|nr:nuclear transport factor 2 family protein [Lichenihabitans sp.]